MGLLAVGFSNGIFELLQLPDLTTVHTLSIGRWAENAEGRATRVDLPPCMDRRLSSDPWDAEKFCTAVAVSHPTSQPNLEQPSVCWCSQTCLITGRS